MQPWVDRTVPNATRNSEVSSAIRSSERRQKMSAPTANHTSWKILSMTTLRERVGAYRQADVPQRPHAFGGRLTYRPLGTDLGVRRCTRYDSARSCSER